MKGRYPVCLLLLLGLFTACGGEGEEIRVQLTPEERNRFQALASAELDSLRPLLDSLCVATFNDRVAIVTDSIVQRRLEEEMRLRSRLRQITDQ